MTEYTTEILKLRRTLVMLESELHRVQEKILVWKDIESSYIRSKARTLDRLEALEDGEVFDESPYTETNPK